MAITTNTQPGTQKTSTELKLYRTTIFLMFALGMLNFFNPMFLSGISDYARSPKYIDIPELLFTLSHGGFIGELLYLFVLSLAIAWFARYPETARFGVFLLSIFWGANHYAYFEYSPWKLKNYVVDINGPCLDLSAILSAILLMLAFAIALCALFVVPFRVYLGGMKNRWQLVAVAAVLVLITVKAVEAGGWIYDFTYGYEDYVTVAIVILAAWLALARTKLGWALALALSIYEAVTLLYPPPELGLAQLREPYVPIAIACLLCTPAVFRWYFPKKEIERAKTAEA